MLGRNNLDGRRNNAADKQYRFSIRKLTVGAVSVALSALMWNAVFTEQVQVATMQNQPDENTQSKSNINDTQDGGGNEGNY
jgi:hypothetical protein